ncbi:peptide chain release factor N(5)-glutamine methyltransferase [bacterium]|nr:peptide chain release factor N(5)-glutamine methyltransferase [bacterium]
MSGKARETIRSVLKLATGWLEEKGVDSPRLDAELLLAHTLKLKRLDLYLDHDKPLREDELAPFRALLRRRAAREPVAYILGEREFYGLSFEVTRDVLVPRPETEQLVEIAREALALKAAAGAPSLRFADVGTGSGCVAIAILAKCSPRDMDLSGLATDASPAALLVARRNAEKHGVLARLAILEGELLAPAKKALEESGARLDLVVANPPYVLPSERAGLAAELSFEPEIALFDRGEDLPLTRALALEAREILAPSGLLAVETGAGRAPLVRDHLARAGFVAISTAKDMAGHERIVVGRAPS